MYIYTYICSLSEDKEMVRLRARKSRGEKTERARERRREKGRECTRVHARLNMCTCVCGVCVSVVCVLCVCIHSEDE